MLDWTASFLQRSSTRVEQYARQGRTHQERSPEAPVEQPALDPSPIATELIDSDAASSDLTQGASFDQAVSAALSSVAADDSVGVLVASIDYFDVLVASHGSEIAKEIMAIVAGRISDAVRLSDTMTQSGDDSHAVLWSPSPGAPDIAEIAARIANQFNEPIMTSGGQLLITVSVGISSVQGQACHEITASTLHRQARSAVTSARRKGRAQLATFDQAVQAQAIESYKTERHLHAAVHNNELTVDYQPIISLHTGRVVGIEALARWNDDILGSISPTTFIPLAEESGLINELGQAVLQSAIEQGAAWNQDDRDEPTLITVNLSNRQLLDPELLPTINQLLNHFGLEPRQLCIEITESVVMNDVAASLTILGYLKDLGVCLAIDDFGTGYSSLSYLRRLPVDILKIDQSFVQSIYNRDDRVITKAIIDLAHTLGMTTVAEGVETRLQVEVLHALNCDMAQGFYLHRPTSADQIDFTPIDFAVPLLIENLDSMSAHPKPTGPYVRQ